VEFLRVIPLLSRTLFAKAVEDDLVIGDLESRRHQFPESIDAFLEVKNGVAFLALEVVVVPFFSSFVTWWMSWYFHTANLTIFHQVLERPIYGGYTDRRHFLEGQLMDLIRQ
jgi:hypothetical protein